MGVVFDDVPVAQPFAKGTSKERVGIHGVENLVDHMAHALESDSGTLDPPPDAVPAVALDRRLRSSNRLSHARVVDRPLVLQARDRGVDALRSMASTGESLADLCFGQLPSGQHLEAVDISGGHEDSVRWKGVYWRVRDSMIRVWMGARAGSIPRTG